MKLYHFPCNLNPICLKLEVMPFLNAQRNFQNGISLIEVLLYLLVIMALGTVLISSSGVYSITFGANAESIATGIAGCEIETLRNTAFASLPPVGTTDLSSTAPCNADYIAKLSAPKTFTVLIANYGSPPDPNIKKVTVTVTWTYQQNSNSKTLVTLISKYGI